MKEIVRDEKAEVSRVFSLQQLKKGFFAVIGLISFGIGVAGAILPVLPGGPFFLFASWCFLKSSDRLENWFKGTKYYRRYVLRLIENKGMTIKEKVRINIIADSFIILSVFIVDPLWVKFMIIATGLYKHYFFIKKIPTIKDGEIDPKYT